jgi:hypothetical protein
MRNKTYSILLISIIVLGVSSGVLMFLVIPTVSSEGTLLDNRAPIDLTASDLGYEEMAIRKKAAEVGSAEATQASPIGEPADVGDIFTFPLSDRVRMASS